MKFATQILPLLNLIISKNLCKYLCVVTMHFPIFKSLTLEFLEKFWQTFSYVGTIGKINISNLFFNSKLFKFSQFQRS